MARRRGRLPRGSRAAARAVRFLGVSGIGGLLVVCLFVSFVAIGSKYSSTVTGQSECQLPEQLGDAGVEILGDSALIGLAAALPTRLAGGVVRADVRAGRTAQQAENLLESLPESAPGVFVLSLAANDPSDPTTYTTRIDELMLLLSGRTVYWITVPGKTRANAIVAAQTATDPRQADTGGGWHIVDFATAVAHHPDWWSGGRPTTAGLTHLAGTLSTQIGAATHASLSGITVESTTVAGSVPLTAERKANAGTIVAVGDALRVPERGEVIAIAAALQESKLVNLPGGADDSVGLFEQRPSQGWGTPSQLRDPSYAARAFYLHLLRVPGWQALSVTAAAQAVQRSAYPDAYAQWEQPATVIVAALHGTHATGCGPQLQVPGNPRAQVAVNAALSQLGVPYSFAGGNLDGPTLGQCVPGTDGWNDCHIVGFDCSGLMLYAWGKVGVTVPHNTAAMWTDPDFVHITDEALLQPGDMMMFEGPPPGHVGMYLGDGQLLDAPHSGSVVSIESVHATWYAQTFVGALRPKD